MFQTALLSGPPSQSHLVPVAPWCCSQQRQPLEEPKVTAHHSLSGTAGTGHHGDGFHSNRKVCIMHMGDFPAKQHHSLGFWGNLCWETISAVHFLKVSHAPSALHRVFAFRNEGPPQSRAHRLGSSDSPDVTRDVSRTGRPPLASGAGQHSAGRVNKCSGAGLRLPLPTSAGFQGSG